MYLHERSGYSSKPRNLMESPGEIRVAPVASLELAKQLIAEKRFLPLDDFISTAKSWDNPKKLTAFDGGNGGR